ncbi:Synaptosomal-associated protein 23 [Halotydeus destructor]|nr:Synaptosomal-associated protein 23 [Halotydeus destructor]
MARRPHQAQQQEDLQAQIDGTTDQSLESTRRIRQMAEETNEIGVKTLAQLDEQGDQLDRIEQDLDTIATDVRSAQKSLNKMDKWFGLVRMPWTKKAPKHKVAPAASADAGSSHSSAGPAPARPPAASWSGGKEGGGPMVSRITGDAREDEMEENLQAVGGILGNLRNMALDMGSTIDGQNRQLGRITAKTEHVSGSVDATNLHTQRLL